MARSILGTPVPRVEDPGMLTGSVRYVEDLSEPGTLRAHFVRSPIAHGRILSIDTERARSCPGVVGVFTSDDLALAPFPGLMPLHPLCLRPPLAAGTVRFVGDPVAVVVAESLTHAVDAAESVVVNYDPLPHVVDMEAALAPGAPLQLEELRSNRPIVQPDAGGAEVLGDAEVIVRVRIENQRVAAVPMEGGAVLAVPGNGDPYDLTVYPAVHHPHRYQEEIATELGLDKERVRVVVPFVGGSFGAKASAAVEHLVVAACAFRLGRPVRWVETRSENLLSMHGRGQVQYIELGLSHDGIISGLRCRMIGDGGAYGGIGGLLVAASTRAMATGVYRVPKLSYEVAVALTNTTPTSSYRGAGRPEAAAYLERVMDLAAAELGLDPIELRRRNFLDPSEFPYQTLTGATYDSGDYDRALRQAVQLGGYDALRADQAVRRAQGDRLQLGIGVAVYVEVTGAYPPTEWSGVEVHADGTATVRVGTSTHGQGHATSFGMIVSSTLGIPLEDITFVDSDTALVPRGGGTGGSRSLQLGGSAVLRASEEVLEQARHVLASHLEAPPEDIVVMEDGRLGVAGVPSSALSWSEVASTAAAAGQALRAELDLQQSGPTFPFGAHIAVVEVDMETGKAELRRHIAVDDCGTILNPLIVGGQQHGGIGQGAAQALWEQVRYDDDGNPLTGTLIDYAMPSAAELCTFEVANTETPTLLNPLGVKGIGESGTIGSTPAVQNAVIDALAYIGVRHIDMPCTPERVWRAIAEARSGSLPDPWREPPDCFMPSD